MKRIVLNLMFALFLFAGVFVSLQGKTHAIIINEGGFGWPATIPDRFYSHNNGSIFTPVNYFCYSPSENATFPGSMAGWISIKDQPRLETVTINQGMTDSIDLQINVVGNHCALNMDTGAPPRPESKLLNRNYIKRTSSYITNITSSPGTSITNVSLPQLQVLNWDNTKSPTPENDLYYVKKTNGQPEAVSFTLSGLADLPPGDHYITINAGGRAVNEWGPDNPYNPDAPQFQCVSPPRQQALNIEGTNEPFGPNCSESGTGFTFYLPVRGADPDGTFYVSKYEPPDHPADGNLGNVDNEINDARICIRNKGGSEFACNDQPGSANVYRKNGWTKTGIWDHPDHDPYAVIVDVPAGWQVTNARVDGADRAFTCTDNVNKTGRCETSVDARAGLSTNIDFWYQTVNTDATIQVAKYSPPSHAANGYFDDVDDNVNRAKVCIQNFNKSWGICNDTAEANNNNLGDGNENLYKTNEQGQTGMQNAWQKQGLWSFAGQNQYWVSVDVPAGWRLNTTAPGGFTCSGGNNTGTCELLVTVSPRGLHYVDFWFAQPVGTIHVSKYAPETYSNLGIFEPIQLNHPTVDDAAVQIFNSGNTAVAGPQTSNPYSQQVPTVPSNVYSVRITVPSNYRLDHNHVKGANVVTSCTDNVQKTGVCTVSVTVNNQETAFVDFWFKPLPQCGAISILDPLHNNVVMHESPEVNQAVNLEFSGPVGLPAGVTQYTLNIVSVNPAGSSGLSGSRTGNVGSPVAYNGVVSSTPNVYAFNYSVSWSESGSQQSRNCEGSIAFTNKPYLRVYGNDVKVGGSLTCNPTNDKATILTYSRESTTGNANEFEQKGSASQLAAFALGEIYQFLSAGQSGPRTNTPAGGTKARPPIDLTFGNYDPANSIGARDPSSSSAIYDKSKVEGYAGQGGMPSCIDDYYSVISTQAGSTNEISNTVGTQTITTPTAVYHNGDLEITGNISLGGAWSDSNGTNNIPSYYLVVRGNIYISGSVDHLDGVYIAQEDPSRPSNSTGRIYTCATGRALYSASNIYANCNRRLTVNGAFIAKQVKFLRSINTLRDGAQDEPAANSRAAEVFNFSPETYLAKPNPSLKRGSEKVQYDFITSLPPIL